MIRDYVSMLCFDQGALLLPLTRAATRNVIQFFGKVAVKPRLTLRERFN
jgi:hypothetical protein